MASRAVALSVVGEGLWGLHLWVPTHPELQMGRDVLFVQVV